MKYYFSNPFKGACLCISYPFFSSQFSLPFIPFRLFFFFLKTSLLHRAKYCFKETVKRYLLGGCCTTVETVEIRLAKSLIAERKGKKILFKMRRELQTIQPRYNEYFRLESSGSAITMFRSFPGLLCKYARVGFTFQENSDRWSLPTIFK